MNKKLAKLTEEHFRSQVLESSEMLVQLKKISTEEERLDIRNNTSIIVGEVFDLFLNPIYSLYPDLKKDV